MDFYRDVRYLNYEAGENHVENIGSVKLFFRGNTGKAEIYIKKIPCLYPVECKLVITGEGTAYYTRWLEIEKADWQKSFEFSWEQPYETAKIQLLMEDGRKICEKQQQPKEQKEHTIRMQQISKDEIEYVPMRNSEEREEYPQKTIESKKKSQETSSGKDIKMAGSENEYYMSRISELSELSKDLEPLEHNSFLLHGYFNYRHLLIRKEGDRFLVGVPGNYYYREEMVAAMFGFPNFVPAKRNQEDGSNMENEESGGENGNIVGEFGYYFE